MAKTFDEFKIKVRKAYMNENQICYKIVGHTVQKAPLSV